MLGLLRGSLCEYLPYSRQEAARKGERWRKEIGGATQYDIHSFSSLSYDRSKASSKPSSPQSAIQSFLLQMRVSSPFLKVIQ